MHDKCSPRMKNGRFRLFVSVFVRRNNNIKPPRDKCYRNAYDLFGREVIIFRRRYCSYAKTCEFGANGTDLD